MSQKLRLMQQSAAQFVYSILWCATIFAVTDYIRIYGMHYFYINHVMWSVYFHIASFGIYSVIWYYSILAYGWSKALSALWCKDA